MRVQSIATEYLARSGRTERGLIAVALHTTFPFSTIVGVDRRKGVVQDTGNIHICLPDTTKDFVLWAIRDLLTEYNMEVVSSGERRISLRKEGYGVFLHLISSAWEGASLLEFTGNILFVKLLRKVAKEQGYKLSSTGLKLAGHLLSESRTEEGIFYLLGVNYYPPEERSLRFGDFLLTT